ncbi:MAG: M23 family metallopeptidase [Anaerolineae bacterium]|nr:M23 family metallopeptidase [Anaerolineae bacterium]
MRSKKKPTPNIINRFEALARRITLRTILILVALEGALGIIFAILVGVIYTQISDDTSAVITATPPPPITNTQVDATRMDTPQPTPPPTSDPALITYDTSGVYAFPVANDPAQYVWTHYHWDDTNAIDIEARFDLTRPEFDQVTSALLVAITNGIAVNYSGSIGGQGYMLHGDDGNDYYYAHMSEQWVADGARVTVGQVLGRIGNTGNTAQFIEPHLHLSIGPRDTLWESQPSINAAEWMQATFNLSWEERPAATPNDTSPGGWPVQHPALEIVTTFDQAEAKGLPQPALEFGFTDSPPATTLDVIATLSGVVNVIRWTDDYDTRIQINNNGTLSTVVISGVTEWLVKDGDLVEQGQMIGRWNPAERATLHYMMYVNSAIVDPTPTLDAN